MERIDPSKGTYIHLNFDRAKVKPTDLRTPRSQDNMKTILSNILSREQQLRTLRGEDLLSAEEGAAFMTQQYIQAAGNIGMLRFMDSIFKDVLTRAQQKLTDQ